MTTREKHHAKAGLKIVNPRAEAQHDFDTEILADMQYNIP